MADTERAYLFGVIPTLFEDGPPRYLDFACETGKIVQTVAPSMLAEARSNCPSMRFVEADLTSSNIELGLFDLEPIRK